jgi:hypothetical protein
MCTWIVLLAGSSASCLWMPAGYLRLATLHVPRRRCRVTAVESHLHRSGLAVAKSLPPLHRQIEHEFKLSNVTYCTCRRAYSRINTSNRLAHLQQKFFLALPVICRRICSLDGSIPTSTPDKMIQRCRFSSSRACYALHFQL